MLRIERVGRRTVILMGIAAVMAAFTLFGCASQPQQSTAEIDDATCRSYGAQPGTEPYFQCRMARDQQRQQTAATLGAAILSRPTPAPAPYMLPMPR